MSTEGLATGQNLRFENSVDKTPLSSHLFDLFRFVFGMSE
jgi:hypothetical protein